MLPLLLALLGLTAAAQPVTVRGRIIDAATGEPVRKARFALYDGSNREAAGNAQGWFQIPNVEAGSYDCSATAPGYHPGPSRGGVRLAVPASGLPKPLLIRLYPMSRVSGRVTDSDGDPIVDGTVYLLRRGWRNGREIWSADSQTMIDGRGEYRTEAITAGRYLVMVRPHLPASSPGRVAVPTFYPDATSPQRATLLDIAPGERRRGVDITISEVSGHPVSGKIDGVDGPGNHFLSLMSTQHEDILSAGRFGYYATTSEDGRFSFAAIPEGVYRVELGKANSPSTICATGLALGQRKEDDLAISCRPPRAHTLSIRVLDETQTRLPSAGVSVSCLGDGSGLERWSMPVTSNENGIFLLPGLPERHCELSVRRNQRNLPVTGFRLGESQVAGNLVPVPASGTVNVSVAEATRPVTGVVAVDLAPSDFLEFQDQWHAVLIVPDRPAMRGRSSWRVVATAADGAFACADCPAIRSRALAIPNEPELQEELASDPALLSQLLASAPIVEATPKKEPPLKLTPVTASILQAARDRANAGGARQ